MPLCLSLFPLGSYLVPFHQWELQLPGSLANRFLGKFHQQKVTDKDKIKEEEEKGSQGNALLIESQPLLPPAFLSMLLAHTR